MKYAPKFKDFRWSPNQRTELKGIWNKEYNSLEAFDQDDVELLEDMELRIQINYLYR